MLANRFQDTFKNGFTPSPDLLYYFPQSVLYIVIRLYCYLLSVDCIMRHIIKM